MSTGTGQFHEAAKRHLRDTRAIMTATLDRAAQLLLDEMRMLTAKVDHDLQALKELGHPYRAKAPQGQPHPDWLVHIQSGDLQAGLKRLPAQVRGGAVEAELHSQAPYTWYLLLGTRYMRPRDFVSAAIINREPDVNALLSRAWAALHEGSSAAVRFQVTLLDHPVYPAQLPGGPV